MDNSIVQTFENPAFGQVRTIEEDGKVLFCLTDIANALGYGNTRDAINRHCKGVVKRDTPTPSGVQSMNFGPEGDVYRLITHSKLPAAEDFEKWVFDEVLPSIRKTGGYIQGADNLTPEELMAKALVVAQKTLEDYQIRNQALTAENSRLAADNAVLQPKADYFDAMADRDGAFGVRETAKALGVKQNWFVDFLLDHKYLYRNQSGKLMPYAKHVDSGLFCLKETFNDKTNWTGTQTLITLKGREAFCRMIAG